jgi:hypothetical protein
MNDRLTDLLSRWRDAERDETRVADADRAFADLTREWRCEEAPARLVARAAALGRLAAAPSAGNIWASWWTRSAVAASLAMAGAALGAQTGSSLFNLTLTSFKAVAGVAHVGLATVNAWLMAVAALAGPCVHVGVAIRNALVLPEPLLMLGANVLLASGALAVLRRVLATREV